MSRKNSDVFAEVIVGIFMVAVLALLAYFTIVISGVDLLLGRAKKSATFVFQDVGGLKERDSVMYRGMKVGAVERIELGSSNITVRVKVDSDVVMRETGQASVSALSLLGGNYLLLEEGTGKVKPLVTTVFHGEPPVDWMRDIGEIARNLSDLTSEGSLKSIVTNFEETAKNLNLIVARVERGEELAHLGVLRPHEGGRLRRLHHVSALEHEHAVREEERALQVVRDHDRRDAAFLVEAADEAVDGDGRHGVESGGGLVVEDDVVAAHDRAGEACALLHAAGDLGGIAVRRVRQLHGGERLAHARVDLVLRESAVLPQRERHVLLHGEPAEQRAALEEVAEPIANRLEVRTRGRGNLHVVEPHASARGREEAHEMLERDGLARAGRSHHREDLALFDRKAHAREDLPALEALHHVLKSYLRHRTLFFRMRLSIPKPRAERERNHAFDARRTSSGR